MLIQDMTMKAFEEQRKNIPGVILPVGAVEQHGPHLPLGFDAMHALALAKETAKLTPCMVAPPLYYGLCRSTGPHPGTIGITSSALRVLVHDIGVSMAKQGVGCLCILTGHAGGTHQATLIDAGEELLFETGLEVAVVCVLDLLKDAGPLIKCPGDSHAGEVETSLGMHLWPELVKGSAPEEYPTFPPYILVRDKVAHWPGGVWGDPGKAGREKGEKLLRHEAKALAKVMQDLAARYEQARNGA